MRRRRDVHDSAASRLTVCLVTGEYPPDEGGVADYTRCLAEALVAEGLRVHVVTTRRAGSVDIVRADEGGVATRQGRGASEEARDIAGDGAVRVHRVVAGWGWGALAAVGRIAAQTWADVVHVQYQAAAFAMAASPYALPWWLGRGPSRGVATAATYHDLLVPYLFPKAGHIRDWVTRLPARTADLVITTNADDHARATHWSPPGRHALVPIGSNVPDAPPPGYDRAAWRREHGVPEGAALLAYFGFLNQSKGGRVLLEALERLHAAGRDARLVMIGGRVGASDPTNAAYLAAFEADAAARGLGGALRWTGHVTAPEVSAWLRAADAALLPYADGASYRRGSLLAALTHGVPVITTRPAPAGGPLPALVDGEGALIVPPGDGAALAAAAAAVLDDAALAARLAAGARAVAAHFGWDAIAARHAGLYREVADGRSSVR